MCKHTSLCGCLYHQQSEIPCTNTKTSSSTSGAFIITSTMIHRRQPTQVHYHPLVIYYFHLYLSTHCDPLTNVLSPSSALHFRFLTASCYALFHTSTLYFDGLYSRMFVRLISCFSCNAVPTTVMYCQVALTLCAIVSVHKTYKWQLPVLIAIPLAYTVYC